MSGDPSTSLAARRDRLLALDAYRGLVLILLALEVPNWGWQEVVTGARPHSGFWAFVSHHTRHAAWRGWTLWDLIQPSFMFMVGVAAAYSFEKRRQRGEPARKTAAHVIARALILIFLGVFLRSLDHDRTYWTFEDVVTQIGLGYVFLFLLWNRPMKAVLAAAGAILAGYWALFALWPAGEPAGNPENYPLFEGFLAHWNINANPAHHFDTWFLNLFPREDAFRYHPEGYNTLNFIPSLAVMLLGLSTGSWLQARTLNFRHVCVLFAAGILLSGLGPLLDYAGICPLVKKTWTPAFSLFSGGLCMAFLAVFLAVTDIFKFRKWAWPLVVCGMNSIALYVMIWTLPAWIDATLQRHLGRGYALWAGTEFEPLLRNLACGIVIWLVCWWMFRRRLFLRI